MIDALSLFSGLGGLDIGAARAGFRVKAAVDIDKEPLAYLRTGLKLQTIESDLAQQCPGEIALAAGIHNSDFLLFGGPPCTGFSHAGFWLERKRTGQDSTINFVFDFLRFVKTLRPKAFLIENVPGLAFKTHKETLNSILERSRRLGYRTAVAILNSADYGVPQARKRIFIVGSKNFEFQFPGPSIKESPRTPQWAIGNLSTKENPPEPKETPRGKYSHLIPEVPPGSNYLHFTERRGHPTPLFEWRSKYWSFLLKIDPEKPSPTIPASRITYNGPFHWHNRHLRRREIARLQTFPDQFPIPNADSAQRYLGNAVPPLLSLQLFIALARQLGTTPSKQILELVKEALAPQSPFSTVNRSLMPETAAAKESQECLK